jgi:AraC-like DNA-binding protein
MERLNETTYARRIREIQAGGRRMTGRYESCLRAKRLMDRQFDARVSLTQIARTATVSRYHFIRLFKHIYGMTPHQYLTFVRIARAKVVLGRTEPAARVSIREASRAVGFESVTSFTALFRKYTGTTPRAFQRATEREADRNPQGEINSVGVPLRQFYCRDC